MEKGATARRRERKRERERLAADAAAKAPPPVNEWTAHAHAALQQHEDWARHPNRRRVLNYGQWVRREERLARLLRRDRVLQQWAEAEQLAGLGGLPWFGGSEQYERRQHLLEAMAHELASRGHAPPSLESWLMARHPRAWIRVATHGSGAAIAMACCAAMPLALVAACTAASGWEAAAHLACAAWAATVARLKMARRRRAVAAARERGSLQTGLALRCGLCGASPLEHTAQARCTWYMVHGACHGTCHGACHGTCHGACHGALRARPSRGSPHACYTP